MPKADVKKMSDRQRVAYYLNKYRDRTPPKKKKKASVLTRLKRKGKALVRRVRGKKKTTPTKTTRTKALEKGLGKAGLSPEKIRQLRGKKK